MGSLKDDWKETGKDLGGAFKQLGRLTTGLRETMPRKLPGRKLKSRKPRRQKRLPRPFARTAALN